MKQNKIFIACDTRDLKIVKKIIKETQSNKLDIVYKFGLEFFYSKKGRNFISKLNKKNIFLDLKLNDIPNTCVSALKAIKDLNNIHYITAHINGVFEMLKAIKKQAGKIKVLGVTILTSLDSKNLREIGYTNSIKNIVSKQANLAKKAKLDGIICSSKELQYVKKICRKMEIITPGIRFTSNNFQDQKRIATPKESFKKGATAIVIGRSITKGNIKKNITKLTKSLI